MLRIILIIFILLFLYPIVRGEVSFAPMIAIVTDVNSLSIGKIFNGSKDIFNNATLYWRELLFNNLKQKMRDSLFPKPKEYIQEEFAETAKNAIETVIIDPITENIVEPIKNLLGLDALLESTSVAEDEIQKEEARSNSLTGPVSGTSKPKIEPTPQIPGKPFPDKNNDLLYNEKKMKSHASLGTSTLPNKRNATSGASH